MFWDLEFGISEGISQPIRAQPRWSEIGIWNWDLAFGIWYLGETRDGPKLEFEIGIRNLDFGFWAVSAKVRNWNLKFGF